MSDISNGTNSEKRSFCMVLGCDRNNKYTMFLKCFMTSVQRWIFEWFYHTSMPMLLGWQNLQRVHLFLTDGAVNEYTPFTDAVQSLFPNPTHKLFMFHLGTQNLPYAKRITNETKEANEIYNDIVLTLYSFYMEVQSEIEYKCTRSILIYTLSLSAIRNALGVPCAQYINDWLIQYFSHTKYAFQGIFSKGACTWELILHLL